MERNLSEMWLFHSINETSALVYNVYEFDELWTDPSVVVAVDDEIPLILFAPTQCTKAN